MGRAHRWRDGLKPVVTLLTATAVLTGCAAATSDEHVIDEPVAIEPIVGTELSRVVLTEPAAGRLGIETATVDEAEGSLVVPSAAVIVDPEGRFWVYTNPEPLVFVRREIRIEREADGVVYLLDGPRAGEQVVTVGVPELYGAETGVGH